MLSTIRKQRDDEGFTLIELLVVVIIIGILAAIAIPVFLNQRENAWRGAAQSDARNAAIEIESFFTRTSDYPDAAFTVTETGLVPAAGATYDAADLDINVSEGVTLTYTAPTASTSWSMTAGHEDVDGGATYNPTAGGLQEWDDTLTNVPGSKNVATP